MNEQYEKSLTKLELDKVLALLADHAASQAAKDRCLAVRPSTDAAASARRSCCASRLF